MNVNECLLVGYDYLEEKDNAILIIGRPKANQSYDIINAFEGEEAKELYKKLTTKREIPEE